MRAPGPVKLGSGERTGANSVKPKPIRRRLREAASPGAVAPFDDPLDDLIRGDPG